MKIIQSILCLEWSELIAAGVSENTLRAAKLRRSKEWLFMKDPEDKRKVLIGYENLKTTYKEQVKLKFGNPYEYIAATIIDKYLVESPSDTDYISTYKLADGTALPFEHKQRYTTACKYLNLLSKTGVKEAKSMGFDSLTSFTNAAISLIKARNISLPAAYCKLKAKIKEYQSSGAEVVISKKYCNKNRQKITPDGLAYITELYSMGNQFSAERVAMEYNLHGSKLGWLPISVSAVRYHLNATGLDQQITLSRKGNSEFRALADIVVGRSRPSRPNMLWVGDGTPFELYYKAEGSKGVSYWNRKVVYAVIDAYNDYVVGFAIGDSESNALAKLAWYNACLNTGVVPDQIKTDNFGVKEMRSYYSQLAKTPAYFTPSAVGNARDKVVEQFFAKINNDVTRDYLNYSGANIRAKSQPNRDMLNSLKAEFPDEATVTEQIIQCFERWNTMARAKLNGSNLLEQWKSGDHSKNRLFSDELRLEVFGTRHTHTNRLTNKGLQFTVDGTVRTYMLMSDAFADTIGTEYQVIYDPYNLSSIMVTSVEDGGRHKFLVPEMLPIPMAFEDHTNGTRKALNQMLEFKKHRKELIQQRKYESFSLVEAQGLTKMFPVLNGTNKGMLHDASNRMKQITYDAFDDAEELAPVAALTQRDQFDED